MPYLPAERMDDVNAVLGRVMASFLARSVLRFIRMEGFDRAIVISSQVFTALIPLFILVASFTPADEENAFSKAIIERCALSGDAAAAVEQLFDTPPGATSGVTLFSALLLLYSGVAFTRRTQRMYRASWERETLGLRSTVSATLGLVTIIVGIAIGSTVRSLASNFPLDWLWVALISLTTGLVLWTLIPYLLLDRQVYWRRLLVQGVTTATAMTALTIATPIYMPELITQYTNEFGLFGITITIIGWLMAAAFLVVSAAAIGAEFDASDAYWALRLKVRFRLLDPREAVPVIPAGRDPRGLNADDVRALFRVMVNWLIMTGAVWMATAVVPGINVSGGFWTYLAVSVLLGLVNAVLGPVLRLIVGLGGWIGVAGSAVVVNSILLGVTALLTAKLDIDGVVSALFGAVVIAVTGTVLTLVVRPITDLSKSPQAGDERRVSGPHAS